ncbi:unnamed protein product [Phytophthora lilii]|uniref:Unnamed protein product n=1 Tax=Phytophthora lilii TaxID=2077276 RepID=A0A9W6WSY8_9STRA|nr:unnamed protein product [Phytophthora lilii]
MNDTMNGEDAPEKYTLGDDEIDEIKDQKREANTYSIRLNKVVLVPSIDWSETYDYIGVIITNDVRFLTYINEKRERNEIGKEDRNTPQQIWQCIGSNRKRVNASKGDLGDRTKQKLEDSFLFDNSSSTTSNQTDSKLKLFWTIRKNKGLLKSNGLRKKIVPILDGAIKTSPIDNDGYKVNWVLSLRSFINMVRDRGLELEVIGKNEEEIDAKDFAPGDGEAQHGTMSGIDEDMNPKLSNADNDAKRILTDYYTQN